MLGSEAQIFGMGAVAVHFLLLTPSGSRHSSRTLPVFVKDSPPHLWVELSSGWGWPRAMRCGCDPAGCGSCRAVLLLQPQPCGVCSPLLWELHSRFCWDVKASQITRVLPVLWHCSDSGRGWYL